MVKYSLRNSRTKMVYHQMRRQPHLARMVSTLPHDTDKSAIHSCLLYVIFLVFTTIMFCVFLILSVDLKIYLWGVKCGCIHTLHLILGFSPEYLGGIFMLLGYSK